MIMVEKPKAPYALRSLRSRIPSQKPRREHCRPPQHTSSATSGLTGGSLALEGIFAGEMLSNEQTLQPASRGAESTTRAMHLQAASL
jgi:hypothetical protein